MTARRVFSLVWAAICGGLYLALSLIHFARMAESSYDNAIFEEAIRGYAHGGWPIVPIKGAGFNLLGDHFSPAIALIAPFYRVFPQAETLLVAQVVLIAISVYVITSVAWRTLGAGLGSVVAVAYGLSFGLQAAVLADFHEVAMGVPLMALAGAAFVERRFTAVVGWSLPLLLVKEDLGLTIAAIGVALVLVGERRRGLWLMLAGAVGSAVEVLVLIPWARNGSAYAYGLGGHDGVGALGDDLGGKALTVLITLAVGGLVAVASPWVLAVLPTFAWRFAADNPYYWSTEWHYSLLLMPIVAVAGIDVMRRHGWARPVAVIAMTVVTVLSLVPTEVLKRPLVTYLNPVMRKPDAREHAAKQVLAAIPPGATVSSDIGLITHLVSGGRSVIWIGTQDVAGKPEWIVMDHDPASRIGSPPSATEFAMERYGGTYRTVLRAGHFEVARRVHA